MHIDLHVACVVKLGNLIWRFGSLSLVFVTANLAAAIYSHFGPKLSNLIPILYGIMCWTYRCTL